jgi:hypothetical protein
MTAQARRPPPKLIQRTHRHGHRWLPAVFAVTGAGLAVLILLIGDDASKCAPASARPHEWWLFLIGIGAFLVGRWFSHAAEVRVYDPNKAKESPGIVHGALGATYAIFTLAWLFEAFGTAGGNLMGTFQTDAISFYVRCAIHLDLSQFSNGLVSTIVIALVCFGTGHWLWATHPEDPPAGAEPTADTAAVTAGAERSS